MKDIKLSIEGVTPTPFMTEKEYRDFAERFLKEVKPTLDEQKNARMKSEEAAMRHMVD